MNREKMIKNWLLKAEKDAETAKDLFKSKHYDWCLFLWHLVIEKVLKAKLISLNKSVIFTHDLARLAKETEITLTKEKIVQLNEISTFNVTARYDDIKLSFYKKATKEFARQWTDICDEFYKSVKNTL